MFKTLATICAIGMAATSCTPQKMTRQENSEDLNHELTMVVGTYTTGDSKSKGIYSFRFNEDDGTTTPLSEVAIENPSYLTPSPDGKFIYAVSEFNDERAAVNALAFDKEIGTFRLLNTQKTKGGDPCYLITNGKNVVTANYSGGSVSVFPISKDGSLLPTSDVIQFQGSGIDKERQEKPHLHCVHITPDGKYLFADDLGTDQIHKFIIHSNAGSENKETFLKEGDPISFQVPAGSGPRHLTFSPNGKYAYLINELAGTVIAFQYTDGILKETQVIVADTVGAKGSADIHISPDGKFLYASNRLKADGIAIFRICPNDGTLTKVGYQLTGIHPRNFIITPNGKFLLVACRDSNAIQVYERNPETGLIKNRYKDIKIDRPVCLKFIP
ncbi:lactonase family protein [Bacteroides sp.]|uniref:lactonase family protein n=1 Tax=Bacteroides sp. TaxID=29523 RepID=UPI002614D7FF|nr:lactonase family protein [Bacteroides sp.]MDD3036737.1 lactonase family protein [Bacteroides sp.]